VLQLKLKMGTSQIKVKSAIISANLSSERYRKDTWYIAYTEHVLYLYPSIPNQLS